MVVGKTSTFIVTPKLGLKAGKYTATITITGDNIPEKKIPVFLTLTKATDNTKASKDKTTNTSAKKPVITIEQQPAESTTVTQGSISGKLTVDASVTEGKKINYNWAISKTGKNPPTGTRISDATSKTFTIPKNLKPGTYYYFCVITVDGAEEVRTNIAKVVVEKK